MQGNTQYVANLISEQTGGEIFRIEPVDVYPTNHDDLLERAAEEMDNDARPEINNPLENLDNYDIIFIGYPIWNADLPPIINTFLEQYNFDGKTVITNAFSLSRTRMETAPTEVETWLKEINVIS